MVRRKTPVLTDRRFLDSYSFFSLPLPFLHTRTSSATDLHGTTRGVRGSPAALSRTSGQEGSPVVSLNVCGGIFSLPSNPGALLPHKVSKDKDLEQGSLGSRETGHPTGVSGIRVPGSGSDRCPLLGSPKNHFERSPGPRCDPCHVRSDPHLVVGPWRLASRD